jgi:hypothetical protein
MSLRIENAPARRRETFERFVEWDEARVADQRTDDRYRLMRSAENALPTQSAATIGKITDVSPV